MFELTMIQKRELLELTREVVDIDILSVADFFQIMKIYDNATDRALKELEESEDGIS